jgi:hypothetical protein
VPSRGEPDAAHPLRELWQVHPDGGRACASARRGRATRDLGAGRVPRRTKDRVPDLCRVPRHRLAASRPCVDGRGWRWLACGDDGGDGPIPPPRSRHRMSTAAVGPRRAPASGPSYARDRAKLKRTRSDSLIRPVSARGSDTDLRLVKDCRVRRCTACRAPQAPEAGGRSPDCTVGPARNPPSGTLAVAADST